MFEVVYITFGVYLTISAVLFFRNRYMAFQNSLLGVISSRQPFWWYLFPLIISVVLCLAGIVLTDYLYSMILLSLIIYTFFCFHQTLDPLVIKKLTNQSDMRDPSYKRVISCGVRSRIYLVAIIANLVLMFYSHINC